MRGSLRGGVGKFACVLWFLTGLIYGSTALANDYVSAPTPDWIRPSGFGKESPELLNQISDGAYYLLADMQVRATSENKAVYRRLAVKAVNTKGVESIANIQIRFDPSYQKLVLHSIDVIRGGSVSHRLAAASVHVVQREKELERQIYDGSKTASVFLEDVRIGDVVDYAYTLEGRNPVFNGADFGTFIFQYDIPVAHISARLVVPATKQIAIAPRHTEQKPIVHDELGLREYLWDAINVPALKADPDTPSWYDPYAAVQWSEYADWAAVASWAQPLYRVPVQISPELISEVNQIAQSERSAEGRLLEVLRFVQTKIRYLGVEIGPGSHAPNPPSEVFARRFGDCKDKTLLTLTMLRRLGIEARAALVDTQLRQTVKERHPSPTTFDHVLVHVVIGGKAYWVDPTRSNQAGDLAHLYQPDYGYALLVDPQTRALTSMKREGDDQSRRTLRAEYDARSGFDKPVRYKMATTVEGEQAESLRYGLASSNPDELQKNYLDYYTHYYPGIKSIAPLSIVEDAAKNTITTSEFYEIQDFSSLGKDGKRHVADIFVPDIEDLLRSPSSIARSSPLNVKHPIDVTLTTDVLLPDDGWAIKADTTKVEDPGFLFERSISAKDRRLTITDRYRSRLDAVAPADVVRYANNLAKARSAIGYQLFWTDPTENSRQGFFAQLNWPVAMVGLLALAVWGWLARLVYQFDPRPRTSHTNIALRGIRGWLLLPAIGVVVTPFTILLALGQSLGASRLDTWTNLTSPGSDHYNALWAPTLLFELVANAGLLVFAITLGVLFFKRRRSTPIFYIAFFVAALGVQAVDLGLASIVSKAADLSKDVAGFTRNIFHALIWSAYFLQSTRVKSTFTESGSRVAVREVAEPVAP